METEMPWLQQWLFPVYNEQNGSQAVVSPLNAGKEMENGKGTIVIYAPTQYYIYRPSAYFLT